MTSYAHSKRFAGTANNIRTARETANAN